MPVPKDRKAPFDIFIKTAQYYPMVAVNIILKNKNSEYLWIKRKNNPAKGEWWIPGGRIFNGETIEESAHAILKKEIGLRGDLVFQSHEYFEEIFDTTSFDIDDKKIYPPEITTVHYIATVVVMKYNDSDMPQLDSQSSEYQWSREILSTHPYLKNYFESCNSYL